MKKQAGFTLVELVVVIAILGILAATALPRFADIQTDARIATMNGYAAAIRSGATLARSAWIAQGSAGATVTLDNAAGAAGTAVAVSNTTGWPTAAAGGIDATLTETGSLSLGTAGATRTFAFDSGTRSNCRVVYDSATGRVTTNLVRTDCD